MLIGTSFVFKKKGLLRSQAGGVAGEGVGYLKSVSTFRPCAVWVERLMKLNEAYVVARDEQCVVEYSCSLLPRLIFLVVMIVGELCNFAGK
jgi:hypothetical protein